jgi:hypothetical protein
VPTDVSVFVQGVQPSKTVLLFGAGSSIPSGAPSIQALQDHFEKVFGVSAASYSLTEQTGIIEQTTRDRRKLVESLQQRMKGLLPTGAILNLPLYNWKSIYTTNYDELIEQAYRRRKRLLRVYSTNFDFSKADEDPNATELFKLHGTISKDITLGDRSRIILTDMTLRRSIGSSYSTASNPISAAHTSSLSGIRLPILTFEQQSSEP